MATAKTTTKKTTTAKKAAPKKTAAKKPELKIVEPVENIFEKVAKQFPVGTAIVDIGGGMTVDVKSRIGFEDMLSLVKTIVDTCTNEDESEVSFEALDYAGKMLIISAYCGIEAPEDPEIGYAAVCGANRLYEMVAGYIDSEQLEYIWASARERLVARQHMFHSTALRQVKELLTQVNALMNIVQDAVDVFDSGELEEMIKELPGMSGGKK